MVLCQEFLCKGELMMPCCGNQFCEWGEDPESCPEDCDCWPDCEGKTCGPDGCGGLCGWCGETEDPCVTDVTCLDGICVGSPKCDDGNPCTEDLCDEGQCTYETVDGEGCCVEDEDCVPPTVCMFGTCGSDHQCLYWQIPECCVDALSSDFDFDGPCDMEGWTPSPTVDQAGVAWQTWDQENHTEDGECALYFGDTEAGTYDDPGQVPAGTITSPTFVTPLEGEIQVSFWLWMDLEDTWSLTDMVQVKIGLKYFPSMEPDEEIVLWSKPCDAEIGLCEDPLFVNYCDLWGCVTWPWGEWNHVTIPIDPTLYSEYVYFNLSLRFDTFDDVANQGVGVFVDDFQVSIVCP